MDVGRLVLLAAVVEHGSITRASAALGFSQPALSRQISALEREAQVRLLMRRPDGVTPTEAGRMLARRGEAIAAHATAARREIECLGLGHAGHLRIAAFPTAAATLGLDALIALRRSHPGVTVTIEERDRAGALQALRRGHADLAVTYSTDPEPPTICWTPSR
jgi:DNA-binding transcriptional LysR family regulator